MCSAILIGLGSLAFSTACSTVGYEFGPVEKALANKLEINLTWHNVDPVGDVYLSTAGLNTGCNSVYFGAQVHADGKRTLLYSMWPASKTPGGDELKDQTVPVGPYCKSNCLDGQCQTNGVQCVREYQFNFGVSYEFTWQITMQDEDGAEWQLDMYDPENKKVVEVGRVFAKDKPFELAPTQCRRAVPGAYGFQEYWDHNSPHWKPEQLNFASSASWSGASFSGSFSPLSAPGYCDANLIDEKKDGVSLNECKRLCFEREDCSFASYSSRDTLYTNDGTHCMLFAECSKLSDYKKDDWFTHAKVNTEYYLDDLSSGFCSGSTFNDTKGSTSFTDCQRYCYEQPKCAYMSYSSQDFAYSKDGTHCMLYSEESCSTTSDFLASIWVTASKRSGKPVFPQTGLGAPCCYEPSDGDPHKETAYVEQTNPISVRFDAGPDVQCHKERRQLRATHSFAPNEFFV